MPEFSTQPCRGDILVVDDVPDNLRLLSQILTEQGYTVRVASSGARALTAALAQPPELILLDIIMPQMDGYEVCRRLKADERTREIPVLFLSAANEAEGKVKGLTLGAVDYVTKPFGAEELQARVNTHLTLLRLQKSLQEKNDLLTESETQLRAALEQLRALNAELEQRVEARTAELAGSNASLRQEMVEREEAVQAVRQSEARYKRLLESVTNYVYTVEVRDGRPVATTHGPGCIAVTGYTAEEYAANPNLWYSMVHNDDKNAVAEQGARVLAGNGPAQLEHRIRTKAGSLRWVRNTAVPHYDMYGQLIAYEGVITDITERKIAEAQLQESEEKYRRFVDTANEGIWGVDVDICTTFVNQRLTEMLGYPPQEILGRRFDEFLFETDLADHALKMEGRRRGVAEHYERRFRRKDGQTVWAIVSSTPLFDNARQFSGSFAMLTDITKRKLADAALQESEVRHRAIVDAFDGLIYICSQDSRVEFMNRRLIERTGYNAVGELCYQVLHGKDAICSWCVNDRVFKGESVRWEVQSPKDNCWYYVVDTPILHADGTLSKQAMIMDITERKLAEEALQKARDELEKRVDERTAELHTANRRLRQLAHKVVTAQEEERQHLARELHDEAGQVLTGLKFTLEMGQRLQPESMKASLQQAVGLVGELMQSVRNLSFDLHPAMLDDLGLLPTLLGYLDRYTVQTKVQVKFEHSGLEARFASDVEMTAYRMVQEALTNVARHSGVFQATVRLWVDQNRLNVQIEDQGVGFNPEDELEAKLASGVSFGLTGMRERVLLLDGQLTIEAAPGRGTCLLAELPLSPPPQR
jgi:PAS domain S-box-containing protein